MKVLLLGATGNLGQRLVPALLTHGIQVVALVRSASKLASLLPAATHAQLTVIEAPLTAATVESALLTHACTALVNSAGLPALLPWQSSAFPALFAAVLAGARAAQAQREGPPLRAWFLSGMGALDRPGSHTPLNTYIPVFCEHTPNFELLQKVPTAELRWSLLCPSFMAPTSQDFSVPTRTVRGRLVGGRGSPPLWWSMRWVSWVPLVGAWLESVGNALRYNVTLEDAAEFVAADVEGDGDEWVGERVGVVMRA